mmetsp:Transcript_21380/g.52626  ORF Transcript_21380/g.52626 Transcript_21380/m.52626 type:complete len:112 (-) Transcript_21380:117-452(-)
MEFNRRRCVPLLLLGSHDSLLQFSSSSSALFHITPLCGLFFFFFFVFFAGVPSSGRPCELLVPLSTLLNHHHHDCGKIQDDGTINTESWAISTEIKSQRAPQKGTGRLQPK